MSDDLIQRLAADLRPTPKGAVAGRLVAGAAAGALVSALLVAALLGVRPDFGAAALEMMFWVKLAYGAALGGLAVWACERLARPAGLARRRSAWLLAPVLALAGLAAWRFAEAPPALRMPLVMGHSARLCPWLILAASLPPLAGLVAAMRGLAPTRLRLTGLMVGLAAGGVGAVAYALHCDEMAAPFLLVWYTLGVAAAGLVGLVIGPRALRW